MTAPRSRPRISFHKAQVPEKVRIFSTSKPDSAEVALAR